MPTEALKKLLEYDIFMYILFNNVGLHSIKRLND
jgi:hypothetical protein